MYIDSRNMNSIVVNHGHICMARDTSMAGVVRPYHLLMTLKEGRVLVTCFSLYAVVLWASQNYYFAEFHQLIVLTHFSMLRNLWTSANSILAMLRSG